MIFGIHAAQFSRCSLTCLCVLFIFCSSKLQPLTDMDWSIWVCNAGPSRDAVLRDLSPGLCLLPACLQQGSPRSIWFSWFVKELLTGVIGNSLGPTSQWFHQMRNNDPSMGYHHCLTTTLYHHLSHSPFHPSTEVKITEHWPGRTQDLILRLSWWRGDLCFLLQRPCFLSGFPIPLPHELLLPTSVQVEEPNFVRPWTRKQIRC